MCLLFICCFVAFFPRLHCSNKATSDFDFIPFDWKHDFHCCLQLFWTLCVTIIVVVIASLIIIWQRWFNKGLSPSFKMSNFTTFPPNKNSRIFFIIFLTKPDRKRLLKESLPFVGGTGGHLRFRKRDKMLFYGRRMLRKVKTLSGQAYNGQGRKRRAVVRLAKRILNIKRDDNLPMLLKTVEPPNEYLEETTDGSDRIPADAFCMLQGIRIFGHFEKPIFLKLCKHTEIINLNTNDLLFKIGTKWLLSFQTFLPCACNKFIGIMLFIIFTSFSFKTKWHIWFVGDIDDSVFIVQSGKLNVMINNNDGTTLSLKHVKSGESVTSLLSFIDVLAVSKFFPFTLNRLFLFAFSHSPNSNSYCFLDSPFRIMKVFTKQSWRVH